MIYSDIMSDEYELWLISSKSGCYTYVKTILCVDEIYLYRLLQKRSGPPNGQPASQIKGLN